MLKKKKKICTTRFQGFLFLFLFFKTTVIKIVAEIRQLEHFGIFLVILMFSRGRGRMALFE
jgi:hypothetical protein